MSDINLNKKASERLKADTRALKFKKKLKKNGDEVAFHLYIKQYGRGTYEDFLEYKKQEKKTLDGIRERAAEDERLRYNALSPEKKEKEDGIERQYNEDYEREGAEFAKRKKQEKLRRLHKEWWEFWIEDYGRYETLSPEKKEKEDKINRQWQLDYEYKSGGGKKYLLNKDGYRYANKKRKKSLRLLHKKSWQFWIK